MFYYLIYILFLGGGGSSHCQKLSRQGSELYLCITLRLILTAIGIGIGTAIRLRFLSQRIASILEVAKLGLGL